MQEPLDWPPLKEEYAIFLQAKGCIKFGTFPLKNSKLSPSPIYINIRTINHPTEKGTLLKGELEKLAKLIEGELFAAGIRPEKIFDYVAGIPHAGEPLAEAFLNLLPDGKARTAKFDKIGQGSARHLANFRVLVPPYQGLQWKRVLLIDDVLSSGASLIEGIEAIKNAGYEVSSIAVGVDREQGGREVLEKLGYANIICAFRLSQLLNFYVLNRIMTVVQFENIMSYLDRTKTILNPT